MSDVVIGVDVGGTKIAAGAVTASGETFAERVIPTYASSGTGAVVSRIAELIGDTARAAREAGHDVAGVGLATPGMVDPETGAVTFATPALPAWASANLRERITAATGLSVCVRNDAHAAAWGEWRCGAGRGSAHMVMVTVGTGIGGGVIAGGSLLLGRHGVAARIGHLSVALDGRRCWCGGTGCVEQYASGSAIAREGLITWGSSKGPPSPPDVGGASEDPGRSAIPRAPTAADVVAAARAGDAGARAILTEAGRYLGAALATLVNLFDPEVVVVGGGVVESDDLPFSIAAQSAIDRLSPPQARGVSVRRGLLGPRAAVVGVALLARDHVTASNPGPSPPRGSSATTSA